MFFPSCLQLLTTDVYISADEKINGEVDWYRVLGVQLDANEETIRKHYRKLALILHLDKNKSVGADGAFKILSQAWTVLSDKARRTAYDEKQNLRGSYLDVLHGKPSTEATSSNGFHDFFNVNNSNTVDQNGATYSNPAPPHSARSDTFWTTCYACKMNFEYSRVYVNKNLTCWKCRTPFFAAEILTPSINGNSAFPGSASNINVAPPSSFATRAAGDTHSASTGSSGSVSRSAAKKPSNNIKEPPRLGIRNMLMEMARREICKNKNSWTPASLPNTSNKPKVSDEEIEEQNEGNRKDAPSKKPGAQKSREFVDIKSSIQTKMSSVVDSDVDPATRGPEPVSMSVPDPDFHDFDQDRTEKSFGQNQVWAAYDDGMPRYYFMIHSVISLKPFKMRMSWLNCKSNAELGPLNWIGSGFFKTSAEFWIGKYGVNRNWFSEWNSRTPSDVIHNYDMVEVLEDYNKRNGVSISPLVKVPGFKTVFCKHSKPSKTWVIPREELFRFSHQVFTEDQVKAMETMIESRAVKSGNRSGFSRILAGRVDLTSDPDRVHVGSFSVRIDVSSGKNNSGPKQIKTRLIQVRVDFSRISFRSGHIIDR
ncbi:Major facilitator protein [Hibiscus syriacus]|uniref:Major facilitator protein n=1 Tax=Hibiscus syriacus TaxID=106335 RepID=A0A6A2WPK7_HIBSY|nr:Major facilitator protein [Hibiscus syriacus]